MKKYLQINDNDNVAVALHDMQVGDIFNYNSKEYILKENITQGHKFALRDIKNGENVVKYGFPIGPCNKRYRTGNMGSYS